MVTIMIGIKKVMIIKKKMVTDFDYNEYIFKIVLRTVMIKNMLTNCHDKNCDCTIAFKILKTLMIVVIDSSCNNNF